MKNWIHPYSLALALTAMISFLILVSSTASATAAQSAPLTINETLIDNTGSASYPDICGDRIVWQENCSGNQDIYLYNLSTSQKLGLLPAEKRTSLKSAGIK